MTLFSATATEVSTRLGDVANAIWPLAEVKGYIRYAISGLYPTFFQFKVGTTTPSAGPTQLMPPGARNLYRVSLLKNTTATRLRDIRKWTEGDGSAVIPKVGINLTGAQLVWSWTDGWAAPAADTDHLGIPREAESYVVVAAQITALEKLLADKVSADKYFAIQVRRAATEDDIINIIDALHLTLKDKQDKATPLPPPVK